MSKEQARKLLGGYATGTLTPEEMRALFEAALEDQELFNELNREQVVRDVLDNGAARQRVLAAITHTDAAPARQWQWFRWALAGASAAAVLAVGLTAWLLPRPVSHQNQTLAQLQSAQPQPAPLVAAPSSAEKTVAPSPPRRARELRRKPQSQAEAAPRPAPPPPPAQAAPAADQVQSKAQSVQVTAAAPPVPAAAAGRAMFQMALQRRLSWTILQQYPTGELVEAGPSTVFHDGDQIRIRVRPAANGAIALMEANGGETKVTSLPEPAIADSDYVVPATGSIVVHRGLTLSLRFTPAPGGVIGGVVPSATTIPVPLKIE